MAIRVALRSKQGARADSGEENFLLHASALPAFRSKQGRPHSAEVCEAAVIVRAYGVLAVPFRTRGRPRCMSAAS
jgi:hypothetical protein